MPSRFSFTFPLSPMSRVPTVAIVACSLLAAAPLHAQAKPARRAPVQPTIGTRGVPIVQRDGLRFRDLDRNGTLEPFEDWCLTPDARARDLVARMTLEEKAGAM